MRRAVLALALAALALAGCESSQEKSAQLEKAAQKAAASEPSAHGLTITRRSSDVRVLDAVVVHGSEGSAVVVTLRNDSGRPLQNVPLAIEVKDARGASVYTNTAPGTSRTLVSAPYLAAHGTLSWVDDQVQGSGKPASVTVEVGQAPSAPGAAPRISASGIRLFQDPANGPGAEGVVVNHSHVPQRELVLYAVARKGASVVAAGRAILPELSAGASMHFQVFLVGDPAGAAVQVTAPATTLH